MTAEQWLASRDANALIRHLTLKRKNRLGDRKLRLIACTACRLAWRGLPRVCQHTIETVERFADGSATGEEVEQADMAILRTGSIMTRPQAAVRWSTWGPWRPRDDLNRAVRLAIEFIVEDFHERTRPLAALIRCIAGNPFRPVAFEPVWRTSDAVALARGIYDDRAFDRMPILADALQEAGCDNGDVLNHCRDTNVPHARGCWVVDGLLEKM